MWGITKPPICLSCCWVYPTVQQRYVSLEPEKCFFSGAPTHISTCTKLESDRTGVEASTCQEFLGMPTPVPALSEAM